MSRWRGGTGWFLIAGLTVGGCASTATGPSRTQSGSSSIGSTARGAQASAEADPASPSVVSGRSATGGSGTPSLIRSLTWVQREGVRALVVVPSVALRGDASARNAETAWREVVARVPAANRPGMFDQFRCHVAFAPRKAAWYLEPARPDVGYVDTVLAGCNPGAVKDVG